MSARTTPGEPLRLGALEAQVMDVLWEHGPVTVREVIGHLPHDPAYTTIATVLANLDRKGLVAITRDGRSTRYAAGLTREEFAAAQIDQVLASSRDRSASILQFVGSMGEEDLALLREWLRQRDEGGAP